MPAWPWRARWRWRAATAASPETAATPPRAAACWWAWPRPPDSLDPALASSPEALQALWLAYTPPMTYRRAEGAQGTQLMPGLAESKPESLEGATAFRFTLRGDLTYSDGRPVLAADVPRAIRRSRALNPAARRALAGIEDIEVDERRRTVRIELRTPDPEFPDLLTTLWTAPVPPGTPTRDLSRTPVAGVGPYRLEARTRGRSYVLTRRRDFRLPGVPAGNADSVAGTVVASRGPANQPDPGRAAGRDPGRAAGGAPAPDPVRVQVALPRVRHADLPVRGLRPGPAAVHRSGRAPRGGVRAGPPGAGADPGRLPVARLQRDPARRCPATWRSTRVPTAPARATPTWSVPRSWCADRASAARGSSWTAAPRRARPRWPATASRRWRRSACGRALARTARERLRAQMRFDGDHPADAAGRRPTWTWSPTPASAATSARCSATPRRRRAPRWAALDRDVVEGALIAPFGLQTTGVLLSERLDADRCLRFHPVYGVDFSSLCLS